MAKAKEQIVQPPVKLPNGCIHTPQPDAYMSWIAWADSVAKTHAQVKCERCGLWKVWLPKTEAKAINKRRLAEVNEFLEAQGLPTVKASEY